MSDTKRKDLGSVGAPPRETSLGGLGALAAARTLRAPKPSAARFDHPIGALRSGLITSSRLKALAVGCDAEDITDDALLEMFERPEVLSRVSSSMLLAYAHGAAQNVLRNERRGAIRRLEREQASLPLICPVDHPSADRLLAAKELLALMSDDLRTVFLLYERDGLTCDEIAEHVGVPIGTIKSRLRAAREWLAKNARHEIFRNRNGRGRCL